MDPDRYTAAIDAPELEGTLSQVRDAHGRMRRATAARAIRTVIRRQVSAAGQARRSPRCRRGEGGGDDALACVASGRLACCSADRRCQASHLEVVR
jgi:hypothetical protein